MDTDADLLNTLVQQEEQLQFERFSAAAALEVGLGIVALAGERGQAVTVNVTVNGQVLFHHAMDGACADQADWIRRKNNVVNRFGRSSYYIGVKYRLKGESFEEVAYLDARDYAAHGGAFPLRIRGAGAIGTITVSGLPQAEDHALVVAALQAHLGGAP